MYYLMNKDIPLATFDIVGSGAFEDIVFSAINEKLLYPWLTKDNLSNFITKRKAPKHRANIQRLYAMCNLGSIKGFIETTHALSLNDTIWVKKDTDSLDWSKVSLYQNSFNSTIARIAFDGGMYGIQFSSTSPEFTTNGTFAKCWVRENNNIYLLKRGTEKEFASNAGLEPYSEFYASQILDALDIKHVSYTLTKRHNKLASKCKLFTDESRGFIPFTAISQSVNNLVALVNWYTNHGLREELATMFVADAIMANQDRHYGNFGFIFNTKTGKILETAPLFDHNISMFCYANDNDIGDIRRYIKTYDVGHRLGGNFEMVAKELLTPTLRKKLINLKGFKLKKHSRYNLSDYRMACLNKYINEEIDLILK